MSAKDVAAEILRQLKAGDVLRFMSWGAEQFVYAEEEEKGEIFLQFKVNGAIFKGKVRIVLVLATDTYRVEFYQGMEMKNSFEDIHCDNLAETIDETIEKPAHIATRKEYLEFLREKQEPVITLV